METTAYMIDVPSFDPISSHPWLEDGGTHWPHGDYYPYPVPISDQQHGSASYNANGYSEINEHLLDGSSSFHYGASVLPTLAIASDGAYNPPPHSAPHDCHWNQQMSCLSAAYYLPAEHALQYSPGLLPASAGAGSCYLSLDVYNHAGLSAHRENRAPPSSAPHYVYPHYEDELAHAHAHAHIRPQSLHFAYHPALNAPIFSTDWDHDPRHQVLAAPMTASTSGTSRRYSNSHGHAHGQGQDQGQGRDEPRRCPLTLACLFCRKRKIACGNPPPGTKDRTCNQCARRNLRCIYPEGSRRGVRSTLLF